MTNRLIGVPSQGSDAMIGGAHLSWEYGFDEPRLESGFRQTVLEPSSQSAADLKASALIYRGCRSGGKPAPTSSAGRLAEWLFHRGGMAIVLMGGVLAAGLVGALVTVR